LESSEFRENSEFRSVFVPTRKFRKLNILKKLFVPDRMYRIQEKFRILKIIIILKFRIQKCICAELLKHFSSSLLLKVLENQIK
jgi:hypothetical protein